MGWHAEPRWYASRRGWYVKIQGRQYRLADKPGQKKDAWRAFHALMTELGQGLQGPVLSAADVCNQFTAHGTRELAPLTQDFYVRYLDRFVDTCGPLPATEVRPIDVTRWLNRHAWSDTTRRGAVTAVKRAFRWAHRQGLIAANPLADMERPPAQRRQAVLGPQQAAAVINAYPAGDPWRDFLETLWATGCRPGELSGLTAAAVDLKAGTWQVQNKTRRKTREPTRTVYLTVPMVELSRRLIARWPDGPIFRNQAGRAWTRNAMACRFRRLRDRMGWGAEATAYSFRHEYITSGLERGVPIATVAELVGHKDVTMIARVYSRLAERREHLKDAARSVRPGAAGSAEPPVAAPRPPRPDGPPGKPSRRSRRSG